MTPREVQRPTRSARELTEFQQAVLVGTLLGDGSIAKHGHYHRLFVKHKAAHRSLVEWKRSVFDDFTTMPLHDFEQRLNGRGYPCAQFVTRTDPVFSMWRDRFYRGRRKVVPDDIEELITPPSIATWLMDDGTADRAGLSFQTHSFERGEVQRLATMLHERFGLRTSLIRNRGAWIVYVCGSSIAGLAALVAPHILPQFTYKLIPRGTWTP
jgi:LAGLIDADG DNA endonuclease family protein